MILLSNPNRSRLMTFRKFSISAVVSCVFLSWSSVLNAQLPAPAVLGLADGRVVEVLGLRRWTVQMVQDSLTRYSPSDSLQSHACAAVLRYKLGFADAAAGTFSMGPGRPNRILVTVREPQDSARVLYRMLGNDTTNARAEWRAITGVRSSNRPVYRAVIDGYIAGDSSLRGEKWSPSDRRTAEVMFAFLHSHRSEEDRRAATEVLTASPNVFDRETAVLILSNFMDRDETWRTLVETMREVDGVAKGDAAQVLWRFATERPRKIDWMPVAGGIHAMLDGTSSRNLSTLILVLQRTNVDPSSAHALLHDGGEMLIAFLESETANISDESHKLLVQLRGADLGRTSAAWRTWIATL